MALVTTRLATVSRRVGGVQAFSWADVVANDSGQRTVDRFEFHNGFPDDMLAVLFTGGGATEVWRRVFPPGDHTVSPPQNQLGVPLVLRWSRPQRTTDFAMALS
jgi:hypothetical protein